MALIDFLRLDWGRRPVTLIRVERAGVVQFYTTMKGGYTTPVGVPTADFVAETVWAESSVIVPPRTQTTRQAKSEIKLKFPAPDDFIWSFAAISVPVFSDVQIYEGDENDPDEEFAVRFRGRVLNAEPGRKETVLLCGPLRQPTGMVPVLQPLCPYTVYVGRCGLSREDWYQSFTATAVSGRSVTVTGLDAAPDGRMAYGLMRFAGQEVTVRGNAGTSLLLLEEPSALAAEIAENGPTVIEIAPGCPRTYDFCEDFFENGDNHGGAPDMGDSPFDGRSLV